MNRNQTIIALCGLFLLADALCIKQTIEFRGLLNSLTIAILVVGQIAVATSFVAIGYAMLRKSYARQKKPATRRPIPVLVEPLRRLFVSVWP